MDGYRDDLAHVQGQMDTHGVSAAPGIIAELGRMGIGDGLVVDLGCGDGGVCAALRQGGYDTLGVDLSPALIALARKRVPDGRFDVGSFLSVSLPECRAITAIGEVFNYAFDPQNCWTAFGSWLERAHGALATGGALLFDVAVPGRCPEPRLVSWRGDDWALMTDIAEEPETQTLTRAITVFRRVGTLYRRSDEVHRLHLFEAEALLDVLGVVGFDVQLVDGFGDDRTPFPGLLSFIAQKR